MAQRYRISRRDGFWHVSALSAPDGSGETAALDLGRCRNRRTALCVWLACLAMEDRS